jgi:outer membrane protein assembly factor BamC
VNPLDAVPPFRLRGLAPAVLAGLLAGCTTTTDGLFSGEKVDYGAAATAQTKGLEVPPDLSQLARDTRYQTRGGAISAAAAASAPAPAGATAPRGTAAAAAVVPTVALSTAGDVRIERQGQLRWLVATKTPEQLWPAVRAFWEANGFRILVDNPAAGIMETNWSENRAKLPKDAVSNFLGGLLRDFYDTGERDLFRTRIERSAAGSEIYISHRGAQEVYTSDRETTDWRGRPNDPELEAEMLSRLMLALGGVAPSTTMAALPAAAPAPATATGTVPPAAAAAPAAPSRARLLTTPGLAALELDEPFDRAWRQVGLALDRGGFTVEDRDRASGLYYVRYVDPKYAGQEGPSFWARMFGDTSNPQAPVRYRVALKSEGGKTRVSVLTSAGETDVGENGQRIVGALVNELR